MYHPAQEKDVVLKCGCVTSPHGAVNRKLEGDKWEEQYCEHHVGWFRMVRDASVYDQFRFYFYGIPAPARSTSKSLADVLKMPVGNRVKEKSGGSRNEQPSLF